MRFHKYQGLGNAYIILEGVRADTLTTVFIRRVCNMYFGLGSDGILVLEDPSGGGDFGLRIFNPDGSEAEKSGNGLRIIAKYLWDQNKVGGRPFTVETPGGRVHCEVRDGGRAVFVEMGTASFDSKVIPVLGERRDVVDETLRIGGRSMKFTAVTVGNPHCVIPVTEATEEEARALGPALERHDLFPNRSNVQFMQVIDRHRIRIEIWERGAGYTLASGSSSCAAAAAAVRLGRCEDPVTVIMPGGKLQIGVSANYDLTMIGPAEKIADGDLVV